MPRFVVKFLTLVGGIVTAKFVYDLVETTVYEFTKKPNEKDKTVSHEDNVI